MMSEREQTVRFQVLGPLRVHTKAGELAIGAVRERTVLAMLLLHPGETITVQRLVDAVWGESPPQNARNQLQGCVSRLRKQLASAGVDRQVVVTTPHGYHVDVTSADLDVLRFRQLRDEARTAAANGDPHAARERYRSALSMWRGSVLGDVESQVVQRVAAALEEERAQALEQRIEIDLALGASGELVAELTGLLEQYPYREVLHGALMRALYRAGRQTEALAAYRHIRQLLLDELGVQPSKDLQQLHQAILRQDHALRQSQLTTVAESRRPIPRELPADVAGFAGRVDELAELGKLLPEGDLVVPGPVVISAIAGTAGVGKTALAIHWAHRVADRFPDGQLYINLRGFDPEARPTTPAAAVRAFLESLGTPHDRMPADLDGSVRLYRSLMAGQRMLVVLDNARDADQVRPLLPGSGGSMVLITSRSQLPSLVAAEGANPLILDLLLRQEARQLLARRLGGDRTAAEPDAVDEIIDRCARLPLALAVVAARAAIRPELSLAAVATQLAKARTNLDALSGPGAALDARATFSWSYCSLAAEPAHVFRLLGLVPGPDIAALAVAHLVDLPLDETSRLLTQLVSEHMLAEHFPGRYSMHDLLREYAAECVHTEVAVSYRESAVLRLYSYYLATSRSATETLYPVAIPLPAVAGEPETTAAMTFPDQASALAWLDSERSSLVACVTQAPAEGPPPVVWRLAATLRNYLVRRLHPMEGLAVAEHGLTAAEAAHDLHGQAAMHVSIAAARERQNRYQEAMEAAGRALSLSQAAGWAAGQANAHHALAVCYWQLGQLNAAADHNRMALAFAEQAGWKYGQVSAANGLSVVYLDLGDLRRAAEYAESALAKNRTLRSSLGQAQNLATLGEIHHFLGNLKHALGAFQEAKSLLELIGDSGQLCVALRGLAAVCHDAGDLKLAATLIHKALTISRERGLRRLEADALVTWGDIQLRREHDAAAESYHRALELAREGGNRLLEASAMIGLAKANLGLGKLADARSHISKALTIARTIGFRLLEGQARTALATIHLRTGEVDAAVAEASHALEIQQRAGHRIGEACTHLVLGQAHRAAGRLREAQRHEELGHDLYAAIRGYGNEVNQTN